MPETVPLDPDLFQIAEGQPANIIQWVYRIQAERDKDRARFEPSFDDADFEEGEDSDGKTQHQKNAEVLEEHHAKSTTEKPLTEDKYNPAESRDPEGKWTEGGGSGKAPAKSAKSSVKPVTLEKSKERAWGGKPTDASRLDKQHAGELGEEIAVAFVKKVLGFKDAKRLNVKIGNLAVDMIGDHHLYEIKTGQVTNSVAAAQWRATIGQPGKAEAELLKSMSPEEKARYNQGKAARIMERKQKQVQEWSKELGRDVHPKTITLVIDPDKQIADVHYFDGFHHRIGYNSNAAKSAYMGSFRYSSAEGSPRRSRSDDRRVFSGFKDRGFQTLWQNRRFTLRLS